MKTEFLQNFKVNDQPLPKEIIDAILAENGRDIEAAKKPYADYDAIKDQLKTARVGLKAFKGVDVASLQGEITKLQGMNALYDFIHKREIAQAEKVTILQGPFKR